MSDVSELFDTFPDFAAFFGGVTWPEPPDAVPLRILGFTDRRSHAAIKSAFRAKVMQAHPDLAIYTDPGLKLAAEKSAAQTPEVQELVWARDVLLRKIPEPVTDEAVTSSHPISRNEPKLCPACNGTRLMNETDEPYPTIYYRYHGRQPRWLGYCWPCAWDAERARQRELRRDLRANRICGLCAATFTPTRSDGRYCSAACRQRAYRSRKAPMTGSHPRRTEAPRVRPAPARTGDTDG